nr:827_t:CDS:10 [Entrophospora candida]
MAQKASPYAIRLDKLIRDYFNKIFPDTAQLKIEYTKSTVFIYLYIPEINLVLGENNHNLDKILKEVYKLINDSKIAVKINLIEKKKNAHGRMKSSSIVSDIKEGRGKALISRGVIGVKGHAKGNATLTYGDFGLQAQEGTYISNRAIEAGRKVISPYVKKSAVVKAGTIIFEVKGLPKDIAYKVLKKVGDKLPKPKKDNDREVRAKTVTVETFSTKIHPKYFKPIKRKKDYQVHNEEYNLKLGEKVLIKSTRPYSKTKRFIVIKKENKEGVADNSGAKKILVIRCLGGSNRRYSRIGDLVIATVKKTEPNSEKHLKFCNNMIKTKLKSGDQVKVISGEHRGTIDYISRLDPKKQVVYLKKASRKKYDKSTPDSKKKSEKKEIMVPIHISNEIELPEGQSTIKIDMLFKKNVTPLVLQKLQGKLPAEFQADFSEFLTQYKLTTEEQKLLDKTEKLMKEFFTKKGDKEAEKITIKVEENLGKEEFRKFGKEIEEAIQKNNKPTDPGKGPTNNNSAEIARLQQEIIRLQTQITNLENNEPNSPDPENEEIERVKNELKETKRKLAELSGKNSPGSPAKTPENPNLPLYLSLAAVGIVLVA